MEYNYKAFTNSRPETTHQKMVSSFFILRVQLTAEKEKLRKMSGMLLQLITPIIYI
jgi:hypothetical protein